MTNEQAILILGFSVKNSPERNAELAKNWLKVANPKNPLRYKVAAWTLIRAVK